MTVEREIFINAFPTTLTKEINFLLDKLDLKTTFKSTECFQINFDGQTLNIPVRIYYEEPNQKNLTDNESFIINCIFTRHHNGYIREKCLRKILKSDSYLATPFITQLIGEYVFEILFVIKDNLSLTKLDNIIKLKADNLKYFKTTERRIQSYWDCYYKSIFPNKLDYIGFQILNAIENRTKELNLTNSI